jgi:hypothetical protein
MATAPVEANTWVRIPFDTNSTVAVRNDDGTWYNTILYHFISRTTGVNSFKMNALLDFTQGDQN